jgi:hypothetical protein
MLNPSCPKCGSKETGAPDGMTSAEALEDSLPSGAFRAGAKHPILGVGIFALAGVREVVARIPGVGNWLCNDCGHNFKMR